MFMGTHITIDQLERMKTHELADLLSNVVLLLRRMPNVECREFTSQFTNDDTFKANITEHPPSQTTWKVADLKGKTVAELKQIANDLHLPFSSKIKKDDLLNKLTVRLSRGHSEQYTIQDI